MSAVRHGSDFSYIGYATQKQLTQAYEKRSSILLLDCFSYLFEVLEAVHFADQSRCNPNTFFIWGKP